MKEQIQKKLNDSKVLRWSVLALVAFTMLCGYFLTDVMSPLKPMLEKELLWDSLDWYFYQCIRLVQCLCLYAYYRWYHFG